MRLFGIGLFPGVAEGNVAFREDLPVLDRDRSTIGVGRGTDWAASGDGLRAGHSIAGYILAQVRWGGPRLSRPTVGGMDLALFRSGDRVSLDGDQGTVQLGGVAPVEVVTSFLEDEGGRILLLRRSERVGTYRGRWAGVSGFLETVLPEDQARREILEETGFGGLDLRLEKIGERIFVRAEGRMFVVQPFRFRLRTQVEPKLDWEHDEFRWVLPSELPRLWTVPRLDRAWESVAP